MKPQFYGEIVRIMSPTLRLDSESISLFMILEHHVEQHIGLTWLLCFPVPHTATVL